MSTTLQTSYVQCACTVKERYSGHRLDCPSLDVAQHADDEIARRMALNDRQVDGAALDRMQQALLSASAEIELAACLCAAIQTALPAEKRLFALMIEQVGLQLYYVQEARAATVQPRPKPFSPGPVEPGQ